MKNCIIKSFLMVGMVSLFASCVKEDPQPIVGGNSTGTVNFEFDYKWGASAEFALHQPLVHPMNGDTLTFHKMMNYISGVKLRNVDGSVYEVPESYYLLDYAVANSLRISISEVPTGDYSEIELTFGVDSLRNVSGVQEGALDPANGMFWSWNSGYIMVKAEGESPNASSGSFAFHLGGFAGENAVVSTRKFDLSVGQLLSTSPNASPTVHMVLNPARLFHTYGSVSNGSHMHMPGPMAKIMADDFNTAVVLDHIHP